MVAKNLMMPGHPRYQPESLLPYFGYDNNMSFVGEVCVATMQVFGDIDIIPSDEMSLLGPEVIESILNITTTEVDEHERKVTKHDVRAFVECVFRVLPKPLHRWLYMPLTSYDGLDTARILQFLRAYANVVKPFIKKVAAIFVSLTRDYAGQLQVGRTHGQHALPITVGFWFATLLNRVAYNAKAMNVAAGQLVGKISGPVGCHNAQVGLGISAKCGDIPFEKRVLVKLGLEPAPISTQILPPEPLAYFLHACVMLSAVFGQFGEDGRNLMRPEIAEFAQPRKKGAVGSSTMPHKINPVDFENLKGMWLNTKTEYSRVLDTLISDHQRDLTGSSVMRYFPAMVVNLTHQLETLLKVEEVGGLPFLARVIVNGQACERNFALASNVAPAEPFYMALQMAGYPSNAHKLLNDRAVPLAKAEGITLMNAVQRIAYESGQGDLAVALAAIPAGVKSLLQKPESYIGDAREKALEIADKVERELLT